MAEDCGFHCPSCDYDLIEYMLLRKVMAGLSDHKLKQYVFQTYESYHSVDTLKAACCAFEASTTTVEVVPPPSRIKDETIIYVE